jgi:hypothetical protein
LAFDIVSYRLLGLLVNIADLQAEALVSTCNKPESNTGQRPPIVPCALYYSLEEPDKVREYLHELEWRYKR